MTTEPETPPVPTTRFGLAGWAAKLTTPAVWLRLAFHALSLGLVLGAILVARADWKRALAAPPADVATTPAGEASPPGGALPALAAAAPSASSDLTRLADLHTDIPTRPRYEIITYTIVKNDTLFGVASKFNLKPETILWGNAWLADNPNYMPPGHDLFILPVDGALRIVQPGDTLEKIAQVFHGTVKDIVDFPGNELDANDPQLKEGQALIIPGGWRDLVVWQLPIISRTTSGRGGSHEPGACPGPFSGPSGTYTFIWPTNNHYLSGTDFLPQGHPGIDIAAGLGSPIYASDTGVVVFAGASTLGYGNLIILDHGNGWQTAYAHLSQINVACGQAVYQGNLIGLAGSTGHSTGPHLHFEMRNDTYGRVNPWLYLPPP